MKDARYGERMGCIAYRGLAPLLRHRPILLLTLLQRRKGAPLALGGELAVCRCGRSHMGKLALFGVDFSTALAALVVS